MLSRNFHFLLGSSVLSFLIACAPAATPPSAPAGPKWTAENPSASSSAAGKLSQSPTREGPSQSSLDALRSGQSTTTTGPLKDVLFGFDRYDLTPEARATLKASADWLKANPTARAQIEGHCDERGTQEYNMALGAKRAQAAFDYLATLGVPPNRLSTISYGEEVPACKEHAESCWQLNRRARFVVTAARPTS
jgi:peptidoglycan-associated lipoprotein